MPQKTRKKTPPKAPETADKYVKPSTEPFPPWPKGSGKGGFCNPEALMEYWAGLPPEFIARTNFYINREKPVLNRLQELTPDERKEVELKKKRPPKKYIDKPAEPWDDHADLRMAILRRYGSGDYKLYLNDAGATTKEGRDKKDPELLSRNLCRTFVSFWDSDYPPILDPSRPDKGLGIIDLSHPANASYVTDLRMKGILAPDKKEDEMSSEVVKTLVDKVGSLADKVAVHEQDRLVDRIAEKVHPSGNAASAAGAIVEVLKAAKELQPAPPAEPVNPMAQAVSIAKDLLQLRAENPMMDVMSKQMDRIAQELKDEREENRKLMRELRENQSKQNSGVDEWIDKLDKVAPKLQSLLGLGGEKLTDVVHGRRKLWWEELSTEAIKAFAPGLNSLMAAGAQRMLAPPPPNGLNGAPASPPPAGALSPGQAPPAGAQPPNPNDPMHQLRTRVGSFLGANMGPLQKHFEASLKNVPYDPEGADGWDFASWVYEGHGPQILQDARSLGSAQIAEMFRQSPYWQFIKPNEAKFAEFLDQVLKFDPPPPEIPEGPADLTGDEE